MNYVLICDWRSKKFSPELGETPPPNKKLLERGRDLFPMKNRRILHLEMSFLSAPFLLGF